MKDELLFEDQTTLSTDQAALFWQQFYQSGKTIGWYCFDKKLGELHQKFWMICC